MAREGAMSHAGGVYRNMACGLGSSQTGENVGWWSLGIDDGTLNNMFLQSSTHYANIVGPYRYIGTAWSIAADGKAYIAVEFG
jgi:uncharacterized protein YkwD